MKPIDKTILLTRVQKLLSDHTKDTSTIAGKGKKDLEILLFEEIDRALRCDSSLTILSVNGGIELLNKLHENAEKN